MGVKTARGLRKANSRTLRTAGQFTPATVLVLLLEAFTNLRKAQVMALFAAVTLVTGYVQNYLEGRANRHLFEEPIGAAAETSYQPES